jgi:hypothetical protein
MAIWQDLVGQYGFSGGYQTVKRFVRKLRGSEQPQAAGIILTAAGEEAQVDYGTNGDQWGQWGPMGSNLLLTVNG